MSTLMLSPSAFVLQYTDHATATPERAALIQAASDPSTRFLMDYSEMKNGKILTNREDASFATYCNAANDCQTQWQKQAPANPVAPVLNVDYKGFVLQKINDGTMLRRDVHFKLLHGGSLKNGRGIMLTAAGKDLLMTQGIQGWHEISAAFTTLTGPLRSIFNAISERRKVYLEQWKEERADNQAIFRDMRKRLRETEDEDDAADKANAQAKAARTDKEFYRSYYTVPGGQPLDTSRGGMTGQLVLFKELATADAPRHVWKQAMNAARTPQHTITEQMSVLGQKRQELMRAEFQDLVNDNPDADPKTIAKFVADQAISQRRHISHDFATNTPLPAVVQRRKNFNHAAHMPRNPAALLQLPAPAP